MTMSAALRLSCVAVFAAAFFAAPANAAIKCNRGNQLVSGQWIATFVSTCIVTFACSRPASMPVCRKF